MTIDDILAHEAVKSFRKVEEEVVCKKTIKTLIDDNKKVTVDEYRKLIYGIRSTENPTKHKILSSSLGAPGTYPKYHQLNKTTISFGQNRAENRIELNKKYSYDKNQHQGNHSEENNKKHIKFMKSMNHLHKTDNGFLQLAPKPK